MKNNLLKYYVAAAYLCSTLIMFAQPGDGNGTPGDLDAGDPDPGAPIDNYVILLAVVGILFAFMRFRAILSKETVSI